MISNPFLPQIILIQEKNVTSVQCHSDKENPSDLSKISAQTIWSHSSYVF